MAFYEKCKSLLMAGMIGSLLLFVIKFCPDFFCKNVTLSLYHSSVLSLHIFFENLALLTYVNWFKNELRNFGSLIN